MFITYNIFQNSKKVYYNGRIITNTIVVLRDALNNIRIIVYRDKYYILLQSTLHIIQEIHQTVSHAEIRWNNCAYYKTIKYSQFKLIDKSAYILFGEHLVDIKISSTAHIDTPEDYT